MRGTRTGDHAGGIRGFARDVADLGDDLRADFAERGWSIDTDVGVRITYRDAAALARAVCADTSTRSGAALAGLVAPVPMDRLLALAAVAGGRAVEALMKSPEQLRRERSFKGSEEDEREALARMSSIFSR